MSVKPPVTQEPRTALGFVLRHGWFDLFLIGLAIAASGAGFYIQSQPSWSLRPDVQEFNAGVQDYGVPPGQGMALPLFSTDGADSVYGIERTAAHFDRAAVMAMDSHLRALALYNSGTLNGLEGYRLQTSGTSRTDLSGGIQKLMQSLRLDPTNQDARFNLELMLRVSQPEGKPQGAPGPGYSPGVSQKGF